MSAVLWALWYMAMMLMLVFIGMIPMIIAGIYKLVAGWDRNNYRESERVDRNAILIMLAGYFIATFVFLVCIAPV